MRRNARPYSAGIFISLALLFACTHGSAQSWAFVVSVGGIAVRDPVRADGGWSLPVQADVSGLQTFSSKPTVLNSALVCSRVSAKVIDGGIYLTLYSDLPGNGKNARCPPAEVGVVAPGEYRVYYKGPGETPVLLRTVHVGPMIKPQDGKE